ncbi:MAG: chemotaxis protein CheA [Alphaproteobacteria bacterium]|nr:chemotaxis protein CheA [Alphaproteobacteria bacterium]MBV9370233.1 chemotaxis protein CheA [Alphaproteobacteria bacterium]MBV9899718.1 chemotaxis protein CheA [Alphaproteobacteria bacterium]
MDDLIAEFIAETREMLAGLAGEIVAWEAAPADRARLDAIFRFVHTVKGNSGFFDLPRIKALSHAAEDALAAVRAGEREPDAKLVSAVLAVIDRLGELVQAIESGEAVPSGDDAALVAALSADAAVPVAAPAAPAAARAPVRSVRLPVELLDRMMSGVSDLVLARNELSRRLRERGGAVEVDACFDRVSASIADLRDAITRTRMQRIDNLFSPLPRMVRDLGAETGKDVALALDGGDVELDREMIEMIRDPLTHIVRNAIDHGIEAPAARSAAGKPPAGALCVSARQTGNQIVIEVSDDGRGIDAEALVRKAVAAGTLTPERAARLGPAERLALVFEPGLSTSDEVTELSGRGVGMDVVRANIERIGGVVDIESRPGQGVRLVLRVPLTLTIIPALTIGAGGQTFALPRSAIEELVRLDGAAVRIESLAGSRVATIRGRRLPVLSLAHLIGREPAGGGETLIVLKPAGGGVYALAVDVVHDHEELVVKPAAPAVMAAGLYAGTTLADDGRPVLLLDPPGIAARAGLSLHRRDIDDGAAVPEAVDAAQAPPCLLFRTLSGAARLVEVAAVERIDEVPESAVRATAGRLHVAIGPTVLPLAGCGAEPPRRAMRVMRLTDGVCEIGYALDEVVDIVRPAGTVLPAAAPGEVRGVILHAGEQVELLDLHWLLACHAPAAAAGAAPVCVLPAGDPWMQTILRPLVERAGYRVAAAGEAASPDLVIASAGEEPAAEGAALLRVRACAEPAGEDDDSIHRYDRDALMAALAAVRGGR